MSETTENSSSNAWVKAIVFVLILVGAFLAVRYTPLGDWTSEERIRASLMDIRGIWWTPLVLLVLYAIVAPTGISMFPLTIAGAAFGPFAGSLLNTVGIIIGAWTAFIVARALGRDFVVRVTGDRFRKAERLLNRQGIWPLIQIRFMPVPYPVVNFAAALSGVPLKRFMFASVIGLIPATLIHSYFIARLIYTNGAERAEVGMTYAAVLIAINALIGYGWYRRSRQRRARLEELRAARSGRSNAANRGGRQQATGALA